MNTAPDAVDTILAQWRTEKPELDTRSMGVIGRLARTAQLLRDRHDAVFAQYDLAGWEFDMLATLVRSGPPYTLAPTTLFATLMVTSGTMTHRLQQLEKRGVIRREPNPADARSLLVALTDAGHALINPVLDAHVANQQRLMAGLTESERMALDTLLRKLLASLT
ncbi:MarR family winged helix-turn-helix transcriptional regulator [Chitinibacteraceae bacterium HSL-7]